MLKCGIIGFGKMGRIRARAIEESGRGRVVAVHDIIPPTDASYPVAANTEEVIAADLDAVFVCTSNAYIQPLVVTALGAGRHVFSEKPPGRNLTETRLMQQAEKAAGNRTLMFGFNHRHHASIRRMKTIVESGEMGRVLWMRGRYGKEVDERFFQGWRANPELAGGGIMLDQGIHMLDLFLYLGGGFDEVQAFVSNLYWKIEGIEDNVFAIFRSSTSGVCASLHSTMTQWRYLFSLEVFLEQGAMILNGLKTSSGAYGDEDLAIKRNTHAAHEGRFDTEEHIVYRSDDFWTAEVSHFFDCIETGTPVTLGSSGDAVELMTIMERIYQGNER